MDYTKDILEGLALDSGVPEGDISQKWTKHKFNMNYFNYQYFVDVIVISIDRFYSRVKQSHSFLMLKE